MQLVTTQFSESIDEAGLEMSFELKLLVAATIWGFVQLVAAAQAVNFQYGLRWAATARDAEMPPLKPIPGRINRNYRNYMETFPFFAVAVIMIELTGVHSALTWWGTATYLGGRLVYSALYVSGIPLIRSLLWNIAFFGIIAVLLAPFI